MTHTEASRARNRSRTSAANGSGKEPFKVGMALRRIRSAVQPYPKAALFELADQDFKSTFDVLVACIISIRTRDETTIPTAQRLFARARSAQEIARLAAGEIDEQIRACSFHEAKAKQIREIARRTVAEYGGQLPCDPDVLLSFRGVGPKCAHLVLGIACGQPFISVDTHVHRVTNRWGYVQAATPEKTMAVLEAKLPRRYWIEINRLLVPFGKHLCTWQLPRCSTCPVLSMCRQVGVRGHR